MTLKAGTHITTVLNKICDDWWHQSGRGLIQSGSVGVESRQIKSDSVMCKDLNLKSSNPVAASRSHKYFFKHVWYFRLRSSPKLCVFFLLFWAFSALMSLHINCPSCWLVSMFVLGTGTSDNLRSCRICGVVYCQVVTGQSFRAIPCVSVSFMLPSKTKKILMWGLFPH